ncbi:PaaI family thioesterase [Corallincola holothuriorum]|uniref:Acyl-coenzyme A thioesterase THEM4 n=1 Tax=Corallincola holothuriorum TaxID=2282215 RepID=A0A368NKR0_9GAMM|nr:PaaI family thioesterase [Corallincola holothuriorum]RCU50453.1 PaaI family thioesterase [Corallincola holothuriorum]
MKPAFQDLIPHNHCFGCGPQNSEGLKLKSYWRDDGSSECVYLPQPHQCAGPTGFVNGGIIATLIDCHCICTAMAHAYALAGREIGQGQPIWYVTGELNIQYLAPTPIDEAIKLVAKVENVSGKKMTLSCELMNVTEAPSTPYARATIMAIQVPSNWLKHADIPAMCEKS